MALATYGVTADVVLKWLAQLATGNATRPGTADITSEWINLAAAEAEDAMLEGGFDSSSVTSDDYPSAYYQLRHLVARLAALYYAQSVGLPADQSVAEEMGRATAALLASIRAGERIGKLVNISGAQAAHIYIGGDDDMDDIDNGRAGWDDAL